MEKTMRSSLLAMFLLGSVVCSGYAQNQVKVIDRTNTTFGWQILSDKPPVPTHEVTDKGKEKALLLNYQFADGIWIALVKNVSLSLGPAEGIKFYYRGSGAAVNLKVKLADSAGTVFGFTVPSGTNVAKWSEVTIPRSAFSYLWGGSGATGMNWTNIAKFEITLDVDGIAGNPETTQPGKLYIYSLTVVEDAKLVSPQAVSGSTGAAPVAASVPVLELKANKSGFFTIHRFNSTDGFSSMADQDGKVDLSATTVGSGKSATKVMKIAYDFGSNGIWNAIILKTNVDLSKMKVIKFTYKGEGGSNQMVLKVVDSNGTVFGSTVAETTNQSSWKSVVISKDQLKYLYGGAGAGSMDWSRIQQIEYTIEKKDEKSQQGTVYLKLLQFK